MRAGVRHEAQDAELDRIENVAAEAWQKESDDVGSMPPSIEFSVSDQMPLRAQDSYVFDRAAIISETRTQTTAKIKGRNAILEAKLKAIAQVLASFGLLDVVHPRKQERLLKAIYDILDTPGNNERQRSGRG